MRIRVNHSELNNVKDILIGNANELIDEINGMQKDIETLKTMWKGNEANIFYVKIDNYLNNLKSIPETYNSLSKFINKANITYKNMDLETKNEIDKVRMS